MKYYVNTVYSLLLVIAIQGCKSNQVVKKIDLAGTATINIEKLTPEILIDSLSEPGSFSVLALETFEQSLIGEINYLYKSDSFFVVGERNGAVKLFDNNGKFLRSIGSLGKGPYEHLSLTDIRYNPYSNKVELMDIGLKFTGYDTHGKGAFEDLQLMKHFKPILFYPLGENKYVLYNNSSIMGPDDDETNRFYIVENGKVLYKALPFQPTKRTKHILSSQQLSNAGDEFIFYETGFPVVYTVTDRLVPRYYINYRNIMPKEEFSFEKISDQIRAKEEEKIFRLFKFSEGARYIFGRIEYLNVLSFFLFDKSSNTGVFCRSGYLYDKLKLRSIGIDYISSKGVAYVVLTAMQVKEAQKRLRESNSDLTDIEIRNFIDQKIDTYANPFILSFKLKS